MNTIQAINKFSKIKCTFGNHNDLQLFMRFITNNSKLSFLPPFLPVMARSVNICHPDSTLINARYIHQSLMRKLLKELYSNYPFYTTLA